MTTAPPGCSTAHHAGHPWAICCRFGASTSLPPAAGIAPQPSVAAPTRRWPGAGLNYTYDNDCADRAASGVVNLAQWAGVPPQPQPCLGSEMTCLYEVVGTHHGPRPACRTRCGRGSGGVLRSWASLPRGRGGRCGRAGAETGVKRQVEATFNLPKRGPRAAEVPYCAWSRPHALAESPGYVPVSPEPAGIGITPRRRRCRPWRTGTSFPTPNTVAAARRPTAPG